jgi:hypothetical protein
MERLDDLATTSEIQEYPLRVFGKSDEHWAVRIESVALTFLRRDQSESERFERPAAERAVKLNTVQVRGSAFSAKLNPNRLFMCDQAAYDHLERWFGYRSIVRMEFRTQWMMSFFLGVLLIYNAVKGIENSEPTFWLSLTALSGLSLLILGTLSRLHPTRSLLLGYLGAWSLLIIRSIYGLVYGVRWQDILFLILASWCVQWYFRRYSRLGRLAQAQTDVL